MCIYLLGVLRRWLTLAWWFPPAARRTPCSCWRLVAALRAAAGCPEPAAAAATAPGDSAARQHGSARAARTHSALAQRPCLSVRARGRLTGRPSGAVGCALRAGRWQPPRRLPRCLSRPSWRWGGGDPEIIKDACQLPLSCEPTATEPNFLSRLG